MVVLDFNDGPARVHDTKIDDRVHFPRHIVARDHVLRRHVQDDRAQADAHNPIDRREHQDNARPFGCGSSLPRRKITPPYSPEF